MIEPSFTQAEGELVLKALEYWAHHAKVDRGNLILCGKAMGKMEKAQGLWTVGVVATASSYLAMPLADLQDGDKPAKDTPQAPELAAQPPEGAEAPQSPAETGPDWLQPGKLVRVTAPGDFHGLIGSVVEWWDSECVQVRGDDGTLFGRTFRESQLEAVTEA